MKGVLNMSENRCPACRRALPVADGTFCPYCGAALAKGDELPEPVRAADLVSRFSWERIPRGEIVIPANFSDGFRVFP